MGLQVNVRRGYELKTPFIGRPVRPFHFAVFIATWLNKMWPQLQEGAAFADLPTTNG